MRGGTLTQLIITIALSGVGFLMGIAVAEHWRRRVQQKLAALPDSDARHLRYSALTQVSLLGGLTLALGIALIHGPPVLWLVLIAPLSSTLVLRWWARSR